MIDHLISVVHIPLIILNIMQNSSYWYLKQTWSRCGFGLNINLITWLINMFGTQESKGTIQWYTNSKLDMPMTNFASNLVPGLKQSSIPLYKAPSNLV